MKERFNTKYIASVSEYDIPLTDDLCEKIQESIDDINGPSQQRPSRWERLLRKPGELASGLKNAIDSFHEYSKGGPTGVLMGLSKSGNNSWINSYEQAKETGQRTFTYGGKRYPLTPDIERLVSRLNPLKRKRQ